MDEIDLENAVIRLYEDSSITDDLTTGPAQILLQWGEGQLGILANTSDDNEIFEQRFKQLRQLLKAISRFTAGRVNMDADEHRSYVRRILERGQALGFPPAWGQVGAYVEKQALLNEEANVRALIALVETGSTGFNRM